MIHNRRSIRLKEYDYTQSGAYFVTVCTSQRECFFGEIVGGEIHLNRRGEIVTECWHAISDHFPQVELDAFVVMPNHVHGIILINAGVGAGVGAQHAAPLRKKFYVPSGSLGAIVRSFKSAVTKRINKMHGSPGMPIWQRNYYEHVIRNDKGWDTIRRYIESNPQNWADDDENSDRI